MNAEQLHKTLVASQYAEQVLNLYQSELEQAYSNIFIYRNDSPNRPRNGCSSD